MGSLGPVFLHCVSGACSFMVCFGEKGDWLWFVCFCLQNLFLLFYILMIRKTLDWPSLCVHMCLFVLYSPLMATSGCLLQLNFELRTGPLLNFLSLLLLGISLFSLCSFKSLIPVKPIVSHFCMNAYNLVSNMFQLYSIVSITCWDYFLSSLELFMPSSIIMASLI